MKRWILAWMCFQVSCGERGLNDQGSKLLNAQEDHIVVVTAPHEFTGAGSVDVLEEPSLSLHTHLLETSGDAVVRPFKDGFMVLNRGPGNNLVLFNAQGQVVHQQALPPCNPHDAVVLNNPHEVLLVCYESSYLWVFNTQTHTLNTHAVPLTATGIPPQADQIIEAQNSYYVTLQHLEDGWPPRAQGALVRVSKDTLLADKTYPVPCLNPFNVLESFSSETLLVGCAGDHKDSSLFQLWLFHIPTETWSLFAHTEGAPTYAAVTQEGVVVMEALYTPLKMRVNTYDRQGVFVETLQEEEGYTLSGLAYHPTFHRVYWGNRTLQRAGLYSMQLTPASEKPSFYATSFPPFEIICQTR